MLTPAKMEQCLSRGIHGKFQIETSTVIRFQIFKTKFK